MQEGILDRLGDGWGELRFEAEGLQFFTVENPEKQIPTGLYKVALTVSGRAKRGTLWTCWPEFKLPELLDVPGRTAIRLHAANKPSQLEGCIAPGMDMAGMALLHSRQALELIEQRIRFPFWLQINDVPKET